MSVAVTPVPTASLSTPEVRALTGATFRQLDYWARIGALVPSLHGAGSPGTGGRRRWSDRDAAAVWCAVEIFAESSSHNHGVRYGKADLLRALQAECRVGVGAFLVVDDRLMVALHATATDAVAALGGRAGRILPVAEPWLGVLGSPAVAAPDAEADPAPHSASGTGAVGHA